MARKSAVWLVGFSFIIAGVVLAGCATSSTVKSPHVTPRHPAFATGQACDAAGCHDKFKHQQPYAGQPCDLCHNLTNWSQVTYHHRDATFDNGMHPLLGCSYCHTEGQPLPTGGCGTCHDAPHDGWTQCTSCHTTLAWDLRKPAPHGHLSLLGGHSSLTCLECHSTPKEPVKPRQCVDCHNTHHTTTVSDCQDCHDPALGWDHAKPGFPHSVFFKLVGAHKKLDCTQCHKNGVFGVLPRVCVGCHGSHHGGLTDCAECHTTTSFIPSTFNHSSVFPLTGRHRSLSCSECHPHNRFAQNIGHGSTACVACHGPHHGGLTKCASCHTTAGFQFTTFRHTRVFPLVGTHAKIACTACHAHSAYAHVKGTHCVNCHGVHHGNQTQCQNCHTPTTFATTLPIVHPDSAVPLGPSHAWPNPCTRCHPSNVFNTPTTPCSSCHTAPHVGPTDCLTCHWPTVWSDTHFTHPDMPGGAPHTSTSFGGYPTGCAHCHPGGGSDGVDFTDYTCIECHAFVHP